jgi:hypothetical protein
LLWEVGSRILGGNLIFLLTLVKKLNYRSGGSSIL